MNDATDISLHYSRPVYPTLVPECDNMNYRQGDPTCTVVVEHADKHMDVVHKLMAIMRGKDEELSQAVREFFAILDTTEDSEMTGKEFHPTTIQSCRVLESQKLEKILSRMKQLIQPTT